MGDKDGDRNMGWDGNRGQGEGMWVGTGLRDRNEDGTGARAWGEHRGLEWGQGGGQRWEGRGQRGGATG